MSVAKTLRSAVWLLCGVGLLLTPAAWAHEAPFVSIEVVEVGDARGVPTEPSCEAEIARASKLQAARSPRQVPDPEDVLTRLITPKPPELDPQPQPPSSSGTVPNAVDAPPAVVNPVVTLGDARSGELAGMDPGALPLQPLESDMEVAREIGDVLRLAQAGQPIRLSFFGASHVGGDFFTGHLRRMLQTRYGDRGHGFVWPAELYKHHRASDLNLCRSGGWRSDWVGKDGGRGDGQYGFAGASVSSSDPADFAWLETTRSNPQGREMSQLDLFLFAQPGGGSLIVTVDDAAPRVVPTHSENTGLRHVRVKFSDGPHRVRLQPMGDGEVRIFGVSPERTEPGVIVDSMGIRGRTARTWLSWDADTLIQGVRALAPDLVVLAYGTNEAADTDYTMEHYRSDLRAVVGLARAAAPGVACILVGPSDRAMVKTKGQRWSVWGRTQMVAQVQREVAREAGCAFWDWQAATGGPGSMVAWRLQPKPLAGWDLIHFSQRGYELSAERFLDAWTDAAMRSGGLDF